MFARRRGGHGVLVADHQSLRVRTGLAAVFWRRRLVAQAELQAAVAGLEAGVVQRALQLRCVLLQHRQRFRLLDPQMRCHLAVAIDIDAYVDPAKIGRIEPDLETALAVLGGRGDLHRSPLNGTAACVATAAVSAATGIAMAAGEGNCGAGLPAAGPAVSVEPPEERSGAAAAAWSCAGPPADVTAGGIGGAVAFGSSGAAVRGVLPGCNRGCGVVLAVASALPVAFALALDAAVVACVLVVAGILAAGPSGASDGGAATGVAPVTLFAAMAAAVAVAAAALTVALTEVWAVAGAGATVVVGVPVAAVVAAPAAFGSTVPCPAIVAGVDVAAVLAARAAAAIANGGRAAAGR